MKISSSSPIGIMDSGWGGLTIWRSIRSVLPNEPTVYIGDHAYVPYGGRSTKWIRNRTSKLIAFLLSKGAKIIVIACNTATIAGIDFYRKKFPHVPIVGVVPVIKTAGEVTRTNHIAVFTTPTTSASFYQRNLIHRFAAHCTVYTASSSKLVPLIEQGITNGEAILHELTRLVSRMPKSTDVIALGCTHYPFIAHELTAIVGDRVAILDSGGAVARQVRRVLTANDVLAKGKNVSHLIYTTGDAKSTGRVAKILMKKTMKVQHVKL